MSHAAGDGKKGGITPDTIRPWIILGISLILIIYGLFAPDPTVLMLGTTMLGTEPLVRAGKERINGNGAHG